jgi:phospholipase/carboxylesterase
MKRLAAKLALAAAVIGLMAGAASAQTVKSIGHEGLDPASGKAPKQAVLMFHGYTQRGVDMKVVADALAKRLPDAVFIFDNAPNTARNGFSWYDMQGDNAASKAAAKDLATGLVKTAETTWKLKPDHIVAIGFSQGGGVALDAGICSKPNLKAVVSLAGVLESACDKAKTDKATDILIVRNDGDPLVKEPLIVAFEDAVKKAGYTSKRDTVTGTTHWPAEDGIKKAEDFIVAQLGGK